MKGTVKWYKTDKGYGFITGEDNQEYWFHISVMPPQSRPAPGDAVEFTHEMGPKGPRARQVTLLHKGEHPSSRGVSHSSRTTCNHCGKSMVPRIITGPPLNAGRGGWTPVPKYSLCPFCGQTHQVFPPSASELTSQRLLIAAGVVAVVVFLGVMARIWLT